MLLSTRRAGDDALVARDRAAAQGAARAAGGAGGVAGGDAGGEAGAQHEAVLSPALELSCMMLRRWPEGHPLPPGFGADLLPALLRLVYLSPDDETETLLRATDCLGRFVQRGSLDAGWEGRHTSTPLLYYFAASAPG